MCESIAAIGRVPLTRLNHLARDKRNLDIFIPPTSPFPPWVPTFIHQAPRPTEHESRHSSSCLHFSIASSYHQHFHNSIQSLSLDRRVTLSPATPNICKLHRLSGLASAQSWGRFTISLFANPELQADHLYIQPRPDRQCTLCCRLPLQQATARLPHLTHPYPKLLSL